MKALFFLLIISLHVNALTLTLNSAKENNQPYAILHVVNDVTMKPKIIDLPLGKIKYQFVFEKLLKNQVSSKKTPLVDINFYTKDKKFYLEVTPVFSSSLKNMDALLYDDTEVPLSLQKEAKHWTILIYKELPFARQEVEEGINFPVTYTEYKRPNVGALDLNGAPIGYVRSKDINSYLAMKKEFDRGRYQDVIKTSDTAMRKYPKSIFGSEFLLYKIKAMDAILDSDEGDSEFDHNDIVVVGKRWIKTFPSDENIPQMLMLITKAYLRMGFRSDANYFLDILISEHPENKNTKWAILLYADVLYNGDKRAQALKLYNDVLYSAKDLDMASEAAIRLANNRIDQGKVKEAKTYLMKILGANASFLTKDTQNAYDLAIKLGANNLPDIASSISSELLKPMKKINPMYEGLLKDTGIWYAEAQKIEKAYEYLKRYQKEFQNGEYNEDVQRALDELFFELKETNSTKLHNYYDTLMGKYENEIGDKALLKKAQLLLKEKKYEEVLNLESTLKKSMDDNESKNLQIINDAAFGKLQNLIQEDKCQEAVKLSETYDVIDRLDNKEALYTCFMRTSRYNAAINEASLHVNHEDLNYRLGWLIKLGNAMFASRKYDDSIKVFEDVAQLGSILKDERAEEVLHSHFFALMKQENIEEALKMVQEIENVEPLSFKNIEVYDEVVKWAKIRGDDLLINKYASKAIALQDRIGKYLLTPRIEYEYINSLQKLGEMKKAKIVADELLDKPLDKKQKIRALYVAAEVSIKLKDNEDAKRYFQECVDNNESSSWKNLCEENLKLLE